MKNFLTIAAVFFALCCAAQVPVDLSAFNAQNGVTAAVKEDRLLVSWPAGKQEKAQLVFNLKEGSSLFASASLSKNGVLQTLATGFDPAFILTVGKRTLSPSSGGWDVFFDKVPTRPYQSYVVDFTRRAVRVWSTGNLTTIRISEMKAPGFQGALEVTLYNGSPLFNIAAVLSTAVDSTAILYDAGLLSKSPAWSRVGWSDVQPAFHTAETNASDTAMNMEVKYRTIVGENGAGSVAVFPAPHQYFYPLDEAFNLKFTWYGNAYRKMLPGFGLGIRQEPEGDKRYVPWFNAPPNTAQRLNFFCLLSTGNSRQALEEVKKFTHGDSYRAVSGYHTFQSHFHNEFISDVVMAGKRVPEKPEFVDVFQKTGVDIVHLAEFHGPGHPKGPDSIRLKELQALFQQCERLSDQHFLLLPGEEANNYYGGHWLSFFPRPVYWVMSRKPEVPFVQTDPVYGKVYHVGNKEEMLRLHEEQNGLAWTAHARTKASTGFPDVYKNEPFYKSETFMGAAWKAIPADLSLPSLSKRVLNLMDDMANWGYKKHVIGECDIFTITNQNEMYAHLNVNYLQLPALPKFSEGWQPVLDAIRNGKFFVTTGEILLPRFSVNGRSAGETLSLSADGKATISLSVDWTFPLRYAEIISGDYQQVYREKIDLTNTEAFGKKAFLFPTNLKGRKWVRVEVWDVAANGAFTQQVWLQ